jgi:hypothetical protein
MPVKASEPCREPPRDVAEMFSAFSFVRNRDAAVIGPIVWEDDGPTPTLKISKMLRNISAVLLI